MPISPPPLTGIPADEPAWEVRDKVTVGIITALPVEFAVMESLLTDPRPIHLPIDPNVYRVANLPSAEPRQPHRVALAMLPRDGTRHAAATCADLLRTFPAVRCVIMVGIAGGIPRPQEPARHVRLGDVVIATEGVVDYGHVRQTDGRNRLRRQTDGWVSSWLRRSVSELRAAETRGHRPWEQWLDAARTPLAGQYPRPAEQTDLLYECGLVVQHPERSASGHPSTYPKVHYGAVASADILVRDEAARDNLAAEFPDLVAIEMEGAGIAVSTAARDLPWFMVRGIADYCEATGKNDLWHAYASYAAAAYVRTLLATAPPAVPVYPIIPIGVRDRLGQLLRGVTEMNVGEVWRSAVPDIPEPTPGAVTTAERAFQYLSTMNADASGLSPAVRLLDSLAEAVNDAELSDRLRHATEELAGLTWAGRSLDDWRNRSRAEETDAAEVAQPCFMVEITIDGIDRRMCRITSYLQGTTGRWRPQPGPGYSSEVSLDDAERLVGNLVDQVEQKDLQSGQITIEFFLPMGLLNLPVEWWRTHTTRKRPLPLCVDYPVVLRSLERMRHSARPRIWQNRWDARRATHARNVHWGIDPQTDDELAAWEVELRTDDGLTSVVLSGPPGSWPGDAELEIALQAEVPVIVWDRRTPPNSGALATIQNLVGTDLPGLPARTRELRAAAARAVGARRTDHPGQFVALLWDDPERRVPLEKAAP